jgi:SPP1 gp7 family putative phage head morphogenesis protein
MYSIEELDELEQEEHTLTEEAIAIMLLRLSEVHKELEKELRNFYQKYGKDGVVTYQQARKWVDSGDHRKRILVLYAIMGNQFDKALVDIEKEFDSMVDEIIKTECGYFDKDVKDKVAFNWGTDDLDYTKRLKDNVDLWKAQLQMDWKRSLLQRKHIDKVLEELDKRFVTINNILEKLTLTESTAVGSLTRQQIMKALGYTKYRYYSRPDERRCESCGALHNLVFPITAYEVGVTASPIHPRCRCWEVPIKD